MCCDHTLDKQNRDRSKQGRGGAGILGVSLEPLRLPEGMRRHLQDLGPGVQDRNLGAGNGYGKSTMEYEKNLCHKGQI